MYETENLTKEEIKELLRECYEGSLHLCYREKDDAVTVRYAPEILTAVLHAAAKHVELSSPTKL